MTGLKLEIKHVPLFPYLLRWCDIPPVDAPSVGGGRSEDKLPLPGNGWPPFYLLLNTHGLLNGKTIIRKGTKNSMLYGR